MKLLQLEIPFATIGASFSKCRKYRYVLWRMWDVTKGYVVFVGLNPSTADEIKPDPTIRRVICFARKWGYGGVYMVNCFPRVSTNPDDLKDFDNIIENDHYIKMVVSSAREVIFAWGNFKVATDRGKLLSNWFPNAKALVINKNGSPRHPLYVPLDTIPVPFKIKNEIGPTGFI